jgi:hypothetical protein
MYPSADRVDASILQYGLFWLGKCVTRDSMVSLAFAAHHPWLQLSERANRCAVWANLAQIWVAADEVDLLSVVSDSADQFAERLFSTAGVLSQDVLVRQTSANLIVRHPSFRSYFGGRTCI